ncbi:Alpha/beta hydrolase fold protein OS=Tsukamurella paurometabola (strain ATCC 8368 / DSM / CCUG 35730 / CIP 100753 / JCM 10117 / KCTC 9821 / NBRC 16120 /NCIMB 702349 / NCTC 13040) OX=521096 GN=Tpau_1121 PE=4 SV=1 [Tsukamurella paurometabola]|uniref:Alpha/beta hydrolase fold protein n=1 Tax=Tsukamurella paurometabola (strain ATCC 8368 / DSM 20162 / CCUG 35730 / CIP 100753 / JCM 10117 / KCTC 9821 / NBRC 16120 / NCIMB 702349 / NCTC 13040) TaxID=521096 RepID=D5UVG3_TSUPD|nr:alpha/beta fold hydrolase [Tsukamurella paurometabola]ADG77753.1 alpha/beta hydrolase fold protein [Tsukamurella paurometabola DSM 20162]SUP28627.1 2-hydroxy-6-oxo-6-phenylhexa-2,4-dienoate hydrolase [Tsukamurella paurometabola]
MSALAQLDRTSDVWPGEFLAVRGQRLFVRHVDEAAAVTAPSDPRPTVMMIHGLGGSSINWTDLGQILAPVAASYAPDLPGFGLSDPPADGDYGIEAFAEIVIAYLETLVAVRGGAVHLVGNSLGGAIAVRVAMLRPDLLRSLSLISPAFPDLRPRVRRLQFLPLSLVRIPVVGPAGFRLVGSAYPERQVDQTLREILVDPAAMGPVRRSQAIDQAVARASMPWAPDALAASFNALVRSWIVDFGAAHWAAARAVSVPTAVIWGARDLLVSVGVAPKVVRHIRGSTLTVFEDVGHVAQMERPVETARLVRELVIAAESAPVFR